MILGFGITEQNVEDRVIERIASGESPTDIAEEFSAAGKRYDKLTRDEAPERYSFVYIHSDRVVFLHVNRRHAFSPDGWACLQSERYRPVAMQEQKEA